MEPHYLKPPGNQQFYLMAFHNVISTEILTEEQKKEELEKLYSAIGYSEGEVITAFPKEVLTTDTNL